MTAGVAHSPPNHKRAQGQREDNSYETDRAYAIESSESLADLLAPRVLNYESNPRRTGA
jgi:hypothetical protein